MQLGIKSRPNAARLPDISGPSGRNVLVVLGKAPQLTANVMLKSFCHRSSCTPVLDLLHVLKLQAPQRFTSTNTAINKSLRRSQYERSRSERRPIGRDAHVSKRYSDRGSPRERFRKPNHQLGVDVEDIAGLTRPNERFGALNQAKTSRQRIKKDKPGSSLERTPQKPPYSYDPKPGGNRATRRALQFGHKLDESVLDSSNKDRTPTFERRRFVNRRASYSSEPRGPNHASRRLVERWQDGHNGRGLSTPEHLQDDLQSFLEPQDNSFTMGRRDGSSNHNMFAGSARNSRRERASGGPFDEQERDLFRDKDRSPQHHESNVPLSIPYTTPASEFLYGTSVVTSALLASRRKLYKLYIYEGDNREVRDQDKRIRRLALDRNVAVERVQGSWLRLMDKMSTGRPHNGYILEASPIPQLPVVGFRSVETQQGEFRVLLNHQTREDEAINGTNTQIKYEVGFPRYPLVLLLDGILDPGNLGGILRTAFFLGVDAVAISKRSSAPLTPVAIKASAGASENLPILSVDQPGKFIDTCQGSGWKICAAVSPGSGKLSGSGGYIPSSKFKTPVRDHPCLLLLGGEGEGLRWNIQSKADLKIGIEGMRAGQVGVDSLNVSVAAGLLCEAFLRKPVISENSAVGSFIDSTPNVDAANHAGYIEGENRIF